MVIEPNAAYRVHAPTPLILLRTPTTWMFEMPMGYLVVWHPHPDYNAHD